MALRKVFLPAPFITRRLVPAFSSLQHLPADDFFHKFWKTPIFASYEADTRPTYRINENDKMYSISVDLPGVKATDMKIQLLAENILHLSGGRKFEDVGRMEESKFAYKFNLAHKNLDLEKLQANLADGVLNITAPVMENAANNVREIKILEGDSFVPPPEKIGDEIEC